MATPLNKFKVTRRTIVWLAILAAAIGVNAWLLLGTGHVADHGHRGEIGPTLLFARGFVDITAIEVYNKGHRARFERAGKEGWFFHGPAHKHGSDQSTHSHSEVADEHVTKAIAMFGRIKSDRRIAENPPKADTYGVDRPELVVIAFADEHKPPMLTLNFGALGPDELSRYVLVKQTGAIELVPEFHADNLRKLMAQIRREHG